MSTSILELQIFEARIHYYCREGFYHGMQTSSMDGMRRYPHDMQFKLYYALSMILEGRFADAIRELEAIQRDPELLVGVLISLLHAHKQCSSIDKNTVQQLEGRLKEERRKAEAMVLCHGGVVLLMLGRADKAAEYADRALKSNNQLREALLLRGWIDLVGGKGDANPANAEKQFDSILSRNNKDPDAILSKAKLYWSSHDFQSGLDLLNQMVVGLPQFHPALVEKMYFHLAVRDWDEALHTADRLLTLNSQCIEALQLRLLNLSCCDGKYEDVAVGLRELLASLKAEEPRSGQLFMDCAKLFSRMCGRNRSVLIETTHMAEFACQLLPGVCDAMVELGEQHLLQGKVTEAEKVFKSASKADPESLSAVTGAIKCQMLTGEIQGAEQQLEFLKELQSTLGAPGDILLMTALLHKKQGLASDQIIESLTQAVELHFVNLRTIPMSVPYLLGLNPDLLLQIVRECLQLSPSQPTVESSQSSTPLHPALKTALTVLEPLLKVCPGLVEAAFLNAKAKFLAADLRGALIELSHLLHDVDPTYTMGHLLNAQIQLLQGNVTQATQSLETGLSYNFEIRDHPLYHLLSSRIQRKQGRLEESIKTIKLALTLTAKSKDKQQCDLNSSEQASLHLELADTLREAGKPDDAENALQEAMQRFQGSGEEMRLRMSMAEASLGRGNIHEALALLQSVGPEQACYIQARERMAKMYLEDCKDKQMYAQCYRDLVDKQPSVQNLVLLGNAYMAIQEPERAIEIYEQAMKKNPRDAQVACKMGQALVKTHQYVKAVNYYREAVKTNDHYTLKLALAELHAKLRQYDKAEKLISQTLELESGVGSGGTTTDETENLTLRVSLLSLLAKVHERQGNTDSCLQSLSNAKDCQSRLIRRTQSESVAEQHKKEASKLCCQMAEQSWSQRDVEKSIRCYKEAIVFCPGDADAMIALAQLYLQVQEVDECQNLCMQLLKAQKEQEKASVMMADLAFRRNDLETAIFHFQQLLETKPGNWTALARLIQVMRRTGSLEDVPPYLDKAEIASPRSGSDPGFQYCKGIFEWYAGNTNAALRHLNRCRRDTEWNQRAISHMIEICLNPDNETVGGEVFSSVVEGGLGDARDAQEMALRTADKLLKELTCRTSEQMIRHRLLRNFLLLASRQKPNVEKALADLMAMSSVDTPDNVGAILGMAQSYMLLKQTPRARNQLKRVAKNTWTLEDADHLERAWLLLSDIYIQASKYDMATELLRRVLLYNKSCCKAYEYMGFIMEKEQSYKDASFHYEQAWRCSNQAVPAIGYKLAFNYLKAKRLVEAIEVCQAVLSKFPDYPKIRKDVLDKARGGLRG